jgi:hypothetical protein
MIRKELIPSPSVEAMLLLVKRYRDLNSKGSLLSSGEEGRVFARSIIDRQSNAASREASSHVGGNRLRGLDIETMGNHCSIVRQ